MSSLSTTMTAAVERGMRFASVEFAREVIGQLSSEGALTCSLEEALNMFDFESVSIVSSRSKASKKRENAKSKSPKKKSRKPKITQKPAVVIPFCGEIQEDWCCGVKFNHGLHTQCTNGRSDDDDYCKTCRRHADNSATGKPPYGDINDRAEFTVDYRDPKGKLTLPYANVVEKLGIKMEAAEAAVSSLGWTIPAEQLVKRVSKRGRPAKSAAVSDTDSDSDGETNSSKKKRGRPAKSKVNAPTQEDQIAQLVAEAYAETATTAKTIKVKKPKLTAEQKNAAKLAKKEAADKLKAEKKAEKEAAKLEKEQEKAAAKLAKKEAAEKLKAEKKAEKEAAKLKKQQDKEAAKLAKKEAAKLAKKEKIALKALEKSQNEEEAIKAKAEKKKLALKVKQDKAAAKKAERAAAKLRKKEAAAKLKQEKAAAKLKQDKVDAVATEEELEEEVIEEITAVSSNEDDELPVEMPWSGEEDDDDACIDLDSLPIRVVDGVEFRELDQDGQIVLLSLQGDPVGVYDAETDTVQEASFEEEE